MSTTTTSLRTIPPSETDPSASAITTPSSEPALLWRARSALREILRLITERADAETKVEAERKSNNTTADFEYEKARRGLIDKLVKLESEANQADEKRRRGVVDAALDGERNAKNEFAAASRKLATLFDAARDTARNEHAQAKTTAAANLDSGLKKAAKEHADQIRPIDDSARLADSYRQRLAFLAAENRKFGLNPAAPAPTRESYDRYSDLSDELFTRLSRMDPSLKLVEGLIIPKAMKGGREAWVFILVILPLVGIVVALGVDDSGIGIGAAAVAGAALAFALRTWLVKLSKSQLESRYLPLMQNLADADGLTAHARALLDDRVKEARKRVATQRDEELKRAEENFRKAFVAAESQRDERLRKINEVYATRMVEVQTAQQRDMRSAIDDHDRRIAELRAQAETNLPRLEEKYKALKAKLAANYETAWRTMADRWRNGIQTAAAELDLVNGEVNSYCPAWNDPAWTERSLPRAVPPVVRFGQCPLELAALPHGIAADARLMEGLPTVFTFPALLAFPAAANLLIETPAEGRGAALAVLQASMFRLLTSLPPGQVRFTIVDPIGIGRNFGAFMHLADYDTSLVGNQVWTDPRQIDEQLADLAAHMETVTQKYLRNEYATIEEYNAVAEEVAEPYRVLVVADFPTKFDEKSAARVAAIAAGGVPCGVLTLVAVDLSRALPAPFRLDDLRPHCAHLTVEQRPGEARVGRRRFWPASALARPAPIA